MTPAKAKDLIERLTLTCAENTEEISRLEAKCAHADRRHSHLGENFQDLWRDERTLRLRFDWLTTAAIDVVNSCPKHLPGELVKLADELGIEIKEET